jgi:hypothetical protein
LTLVDFNLSETSHYLEKLFPEQYSKYPAFQRVRESFDKVPEIQAYYAKETALKAPFLPISFAAIKF